MTNLSAERFEDFFNALWGRPAFDWQRKLAERVVDNVEKPWPDVIALPTASGKTACLDIAVYALAAQAERVKAARPLTAARRIFFVVDRRIIVDEAYERAHTISAKLRNPSDGILEEVAEALCLIARGTPGRANGEDPLAVFELRGGMYRSEAWARSPLQPTIVASTVDQLGSRLLFRAYGRGRGMLPVYAGLVGNDSLILLDEAHCARPFLQTLQAVARYRSWAEAPLQTQFYPVVMSATPPAGFGDVFRDASDQPTDSDHPLGRRQLAAKPATLRIAKKAKGKNANPELARELVEAAKKLTKDDNKAVVIFVNRVATARETYRLLRTTHGERATLLTGRMRAIDKDDAVVDRLEPLMSHHAVGRQLDHPAFIVATQTLEVGADLDFDALVTECASLDALRQRFGRLNRMGRPIEAHAVIFVRADQAEKSDDDPVYGAALANTWNTLQKWATSDGEVDFGIAALDSYVTETGELADLDAPSSSAPVMLPAHIDCWVQTSPEPLPTPDVGLFLRGPQRERADVQVCWRADIDSKCPEASSDILTICPPASAECLPVPISVFRRWMSGDAAEDDSPDVGAAASADLIVGAENPEGRWILRWRGPTDVEPATDPQVIRPGDVVVIPAHETDWRCLGDLPYTRDEPPVLDWGDRAYRQTRAKALLRLHPAVIEQWPEFPTRTLLREIATTARELYEQDPDALFAGVREALRSVTDDATAPDWLHEVAAALVGDKRLRRGIMLHPIEGLILQGSQRLPATRKDNDVFSDEDDASASGTVRVSLFEHLPGVADYAKQFAEGCGLPAALAEAVRQAGLFHDLGKADPRFQALLRNGNPWMQGELLAKSNDIPQGRAAYNRARNTSGYPEGGRHELLSVRLVESAPDLLHDDADLKDLVLHLVASHHGYCRPFAPVVFDDNPVEVKVQFNGRLLSHSSDTRLERLDSGIADRFWRLTRRYGWWGLAWLEAILRLADHRRSEAEMRITEEPRDGSD
ncbi:MAG: type I-G CRISPR-associated helicase/endonuclease Cas3g [Gammaproteobacteria bacterium]